MVNKRRKIVTSILILLIGFIFIGNRAQAAGSIYRSTSATLYPGDTFTIVVDTHQSRRVYYDIRLNNSNSSVVTGPGLYTSSSDDSSRLTFTFKALKPGNATISLQDVYSEDENGNLLNLSGSVNITVKSKPTNPAPSNPGSNSGSNPGSNSGSDTGQGLDDGTYNSDLPKGESDEERKARELEERKKVPLIKNVKVSSESNRLKGEVVSELNTEGSKFDYNFTLPRGVDAFKLDLTPLNDKVKLDYKQMYKLDAGHDKVDIIVKATDGEISQEFKFQVKKSAESKVAYSFGDRKYTLFNDEILNKNLKEYGFEYKKIENANDAFDHYFEFNGNRFVLVVDDENNAKWLMIDEKKNVIDEVFIVSDKDKNVTVLVNEMLNEEDDRTYGGNRYEKLEVSLAKDFIDFGFDFVFNNEVYGWINDDNSLFTHAVLKKNNRRLVYLNHDGKSEVAYVAFDRNFDSPYLYGLIGFGILMTVGFISSLVVIRKRNKQINHLLNRRSAIEVQEVQ